MILIGITGAIGHGKTTLLDCFCRDEPQTQVGESSLLISEVANAVNESLAKATHLPAANDVLGANALIVPALGRALQEVSGESFDPQILEIAQQDTANHALQYDKLWQYLMTAREQPTMLRTAITPSNKYDYRELLQWIGGYVTYRLGKSLWYETLVGRARQAGESGCPLYIIGGVRFPEDELVLRKAGGILLEIKRPALAEADSHDPTERMRASLHADSLVINDGTIADLEHAAHEVLTDLRTHALQPRYVASTATAASTPPTFPTS